MIRTSKGQSFVEYSVVLIVILAVFLSMQNYMKRGIQGRWKAAVDELGDQYDPRDANSLINYSVVTSSNTIVGIVPSADGYWTMRQDSTNSTETKNGQTTVESVKQ
jgi:hypothetical protein